MTIASPPPVLSPTGEALVVTRRRASATIKRLELSACTGAGITITLPAAPNVGDVCAVGDDASNASVNNITVNGNGANIEGSATFTLTVNDQIEVFLFEGVQWRRTIAVHQVFASALGPVKGSIQYQPTTDLDIPPAVPVPTGTGIGHYVGGVLQAAATLIVNADVDPAAAIATSKIAPLLALGDGATTITINSPLVKNTNLPKVTPESGVKTLVIAAATTTHVSIKTGIQADESWYLSARVSCALTEPADATHAFSATIGGCVVEVDGVSTLSGAAPTPVLLGGNADTIATPTVAVDGADGVEVQIVTPDATSRRWSVEWNLVRVAP